MKTKNLKNIVKAIAKVAGKNNTVLPIVDNVLVQGQNLIVTDLNMFLTIKLPDESMNGNYLLDIKEFKSLVGTFEDISVTQVDADGRVYLIGDGAEIKIKGDDWEDFPKEPIQVMDAVGVLTTKDVENLKEALSYVSKDEFRPAMTWVAIRDNRIFGTDAHKLFFEPTQIEGQHFIEPKAIEIMNIFGGEWAMARNEKRIALTNGDVTIHFVELDNQMPDYNAVIPEKSTIEVAVSREELVSTIKQAIKFANETTHQVKLSINGSLKVSAEDMDFDKEYSKHITKGYTKSGDDIEIGFNGKFLLDVLQKSESKSTSLQMTTPSRATIINGNVLLMPVILDV